MPSFLFFVVSIVLSTTCLTDAVHTESGVDATECQWANVIHFGSTCTGTYLGDGVVVSAAHCDAPGSVRFAEFGKGGFEDGSFRITVKEDNQGIRMCVRHPDYIGGSGGDGVDIMYCLLDENDENYNKLDEVPIISPMMPTGCERDWLSVQVYKIHRCPGVGSSKWSCHDKGPPVVGVGVGCANAAIAGSTGCSMDDRKRYSVPDFRLVRQENHNQDPTSLYVYDTETGSGVMSGDSGGPLYVELPDGTWRQIGVLHSSGIGANYAALPNRLRWIENNSGRDITPCHTWQGGSYQYTGNCGGQYPLDPEDPPNSARWDASNGCSTGMPFASLSLGECGVWGLPLEIVGPDGGFDRLTQGDMFGDSLASFRVQETLCIRGPRLSDREERAICGLSIGNNGNQSIPCNDDIGCFGTSGGGDGDCIVPRCCEEDCCGPGTAYSPSQGACIADPSSAGFTEGMHSTQYELGCVERACCEEDCCRGVLNVFYDASIGFCVLRGA